MAKNKKKTIRTNRYKKITKQVIESSFIKGLMNVLAVIYVFLMLVAMAILVLTIVAYTMSLLDWSKLNIQFYSSLLEFVKALVWPIVVVVGIVAFSGELKKLMRRITELEFKGAAARLQPSGDLQVPPEASDARFLKSEVNDDTIQKATESDEEYSERIYHMPQTQLAFERTYRIIFGTQIELLMKAASSLSVGLTIENTQAYHSKCLRLINNSSYKFEDYINFLTSQGLLAYDVQANIFSILPAGKLFLRYLLEQGINDPGLKNY